MKLSESGDITYKKKSTKIKNFGGAGWSRGDEIRWSNRGKIFTFTFFILRNKKREENFTLVPLRERLNRSGAS
jgi:hypothetical protein